MSLDADRIEDDQGIESFQRRPVGLPFANLLPGGRIQRGCQSRHRSWGMVRNSRSFVPWAGP
jgi:hypothetical protein